jgi:two-component system, NtrC family, response regulator HydG
VDVRIIAATNRDLEEMVKARQFREDLLFRLNVFPIRLPALRERGGDVPRLVEHVLQRHGSSAAQITPAALRALERHPFPGNVRELEHALERALILAGSDPIGVEHLPFGAMPAAAPGGAPAWVPAIPPEGLSLEVLERELILQALERAGGNKSQAARLLGLTRRTLYSRMERHGLRKPGEGEEVDGDAKE